MHCNRLTYLFYFILVLIACQSKETQPSSAALPDDRLKAIADSLAQTYMIVDGHVDLPYRLQIKKFRLEKKYIGIPVSSQEGDFDYVRAKRGGLDAPFMSIYIPARYQQTGGAKQLADSLINMVQGIIGAHPDKFAEGRSPQQVETNTKEGKISLPFGMENGAAIENDIQNVKHFFDRGVRYITLTHSKDNLICDSSYDTTKTWNGLSPFGEKVVKEMNKTGVMVDVSHVSDSAFYDVMRITHVPVIASHSSCRHFTPGFQRNMSDDMLKALGKNDGVIMINFGATFIDSVAKKNEPLRDSLEKILVSKGLTSRDSAARNIMDQFAKNHKDLFSDVERVADHIDHAVRLAGIDHVGLGSDFDGVGDSLPAGLKDVSQYPNLIFVLLKRGYSFEDIEKICSKNLFRVWNKVIAAAGG